MPDLQPIPNRANRLLIVVLAALAIFQFGAAYHSLTLPAVVSLLPPLELIAALAWGIGFAWLTWQAAHHRYRRTSGLALVAFIVYSTARVSIFSRADYDRNRLPFLWVVISMILIAAVAYGLRWRRMQSTEKNL